VQLSPAEPPCTLTSLDWASREAKAMSLLLVYIVSVIIGQSIAITTGLLVDRYYSSYGGLMVFIALYFFMFWLTWKISVRITEPKSPPQQS
jgi:hypothetical protein